MQTSENQVSLRQFNEHVAGLRAGAGRQYDRQINRDLARQQWQDLMLRNAVATVRQVYGEALRKLHTLSFERDEVPVSKALSVLTTQALQAFDGFADDFLRTIVEKHRTSCALSNFPDEHKPDRVYLTEVQQAVAAEWREFALQVNGYMLKKQRAVGRE